MISLDAQVELGRLDCSVAESLSRSVSHAVRCDALGIYAACNVKRKVPHAEQRGLNCYQEGCVVVWE